MGKKLGKNNQPLSFQFTHPGDEHSKGKKVNGKLFLKEWNLAEKPGQMTTHSRKYIRSQGEYIDKSGKTHQKSLDFWGEWEPDSISLPYKTGNKNDEHSANYYHIPFLSIIEYPYKGENTIGKKIAQIKNNRHEKVVKDNRKYQNTDPFVYGDCFMYSSICKPEQTLDLNPGSIILFGSCQKYDSEWYYRVDTVFVIKEVLDVTEDIINRYRNTDTVYYEAALKFLDLKDGISHKLFIGATPDEPINGMYSFIPAHISSDKSYGTMVIDHSLSEFERVTYVQSRGRVVYDNKCEGGNYKFWKKLIDYTYKKGYVPATKISTPPVFNNINDLTRFIDKLISE